MTDDGLGVSLGYGASAGNVSWPDPYSGDAPGTDGATRLRAVVADIRLAAADPPADAVRAVPVPVNAAPGPSDAAGGPAAPAQAAAVPSPADVTADQLRAIMPNAGDQANRYAGALNEAMAAHGITTPAQRATFLAQVSVESGQLQGTAENLDYSAHRIAQVWPRRFPTDAAAAPYAHNPEALGNRTYAGRLGNGDEASGDGFRFRGRGLMQVTGRDAYRQQGFEANPDGMAEPRNAANSAATFWQDNGLGGQTGALTRAQFDAVSRTVNGGDTGLQARWDAYQRALDGLGVAR